MGRGTARSCLFTIFVNRRADEEILPARARENLRENPWRVHQYGLVPVGGKFGVESKSGFIGKRYPHTDGVMGCVCEFIYLLFSAFKNGKHFILNFCNINLAPP